MRDKRMPSRSRAARKPTKRKHSERELAAIANKQAVLQFQDDEGVLETFQPNCLVEPQPAINYSQEKNN